MDTKQIYTTHKYTKPDRKDIAATLELLKQLNDNDNTNTAVEGDSEQGEASKDVATLLDGIELPWGGITGVNSAVVVWQHRCSSLTNVQRMFLLKIGIKKMNKLHKTEREKRGTDRKDSAQEMVLSNVLSEMPTVPKFLSDKAKAIWLTTAKDRFDRKLLFEADLGLITCFACEMGQYLEISESLSTDGLTYTDKNGVRRANPLTRLQRAAFESSLKAAKILGISPYYREKVIGAVDDPDYFDPGAEYVD